MNAYTYFNSGLIIPKSFSWNWDFEAYQKRYMEPGGQSNPLHNDPQLSSGCWTWKRTLPAAKHFPERTILCSPEDIRCCRAHAKGDAVLCEDCELPICRSCLETSCLRDEFGIPEALANDNYHGFVTAVLYKYKVRWIEAVAACPIFTALLTYYAEGDRGHLFEETMHKPQRGYNVRGNCYSFHMPWEQILKQLNFVVNAEEGVEVLPHPPEMLKYLVQFSLRIGDVVDLNKWLPQARLRPHVVLKLCLSLVDAGYPFKGMPDNVRARIREQVQRHYPETEEHLPENMRQGEIPAVVRAAIEENITAVPRESDAGMKQKHATPNVAPGKVALVFEDVRPYSCFPDRSSDLIVPADAAELLAMRKQYHLSASTDVDLVKQWNSHYFAEAFPFSIARVVGGADFPFQARYRRPAEAPELEPLEWAKMLSMRAEASIRNDWLAIPSARNLTTKHKALCGKDLACKHAVDTDRAGVDTAAEITTAAEELYRKLENGFRLLSI